MEQPTNIPTKHRLTFSKIIHMLMVLAFLSIHLSFTLAAENSADQKNAKNCQAILALPSNAEIILLIAADQALKLTEVQKQATALGFHQMTLNLPTPENPFFQISGTIGSATISGLEAIDGIVNVGIGVLILADEEFASSEEDTPRRRDFITSLITAGLVLDSFEYGVFSGYALNINSFHKLSQIQGVDTVDFNRLRQKR